MRLDRRALPSALICAAIGALLIVSLLGSNALLVVAAPAGLIGIYAIYRYPVMGLVAISGATALSHTGLTGFSLAGAPVTMGKLSALVAISLWTLRALAARAPILETNRLTLPYILILLTMIMPMSQAIVPKLSIIGIQSWLLLGVLSHLAYTISYRHDLARPMTGLAVLTSMGLLYGWLLGGIRYDRLEGLSANANVWANGVVILCTPLFGALTIHRGALFTVLQLTLASLLMINVLGSASRGALATLAVAGVFIVLMLRKRRLVLAGVVGFGILGLSLTDYSMLIERFTTLAMDVDASSNHREEAFWTGVAIIRDHGVWGIGVDQFKFYFASETGTGELLAPHNMYLRLATEQGIPGIASHLVFFGVLAYSIRNMLIYGIGARLEPLLWGLAGGVAAWLMAGLLGEYMMDTQAQVWIGMILGLERRLREEAAALPSDRDEREVWR